MSQHLQLLAQYNPQHFVALCEHGMVHLIWDQLSFRLPADDFLHIADTLAETTRSDDRTAIHTLLITLNWDTAGLAQLWIDEQGFTLPPEDFDLLTHMLYEARCALHAMDVDTAAPAGLQRGKACCTLPTLSDTSFFQN